MEPNPMNTQTHCRRLVAGALVVLMLLLASAAAVMASTTGKLSGRIVDTKGEPLPGTNVLIVGTTLGGVSDVDGYYSIINVPPGTYDVQYRFVGYRPVTVRQVQVSVNNTTKRDVTLVEESITAEAVIVTAEKPVVEVNLTSTISTVSDKDIQALPVQSLQDIVNLQAGVVDGHFRGGRDGEVQYQVNGVSVNNAYDNKSSIQIDRSLIQEVQVITGTFDAEYGQAMSGVVNTVLKTGTDKFEWNAEVLAGDFVYQSGGKRGLTYKAHPGSDQNYQLSVSGPTGLPQTYFLVSGRRYWFDDYLYGNRRFTPFDSADFQAKTVAPTGDNKSEAIGYTHEWSGLTKITNKSIAGIELSYQALADYSKGRRTLFAWRLNPDGMTTQTTTSFVHGIDMTHVLSTSTFYTIALRQNYFDYTDWAYDNFYDTRYDKAGQARSLDATYEYGAIVQGVDFSRFRQKTNAGVAKLAVTSQVTREHQLKAGVEVQYSDIQFGTPGTLTYLDVGGVQTLVRYVNNPPDYPGIQYYKPVSLAAFGQDMIEWNDLTIRAGVRFEYFDARATIPSDLANPANAIQGAPASHPKATTKKSSFAPRLGISYPITPTSSVFFSYGHFYQLPPLRDIFTNADYTRLERIQAGTNDYGVLGNPDVKPERTVQYEFGYKSAVSDNLGVSVNMFYKDIRDLLGVQFVNTYSDATYSRLTNIDFGSVMGFTISLTQRRIGIVNSTLDYTWQMAQGNSSDPNETALLAEAGFDPRPRQVPLDWDQRHTLNMTVQLSQPDNYSLSTILHFGSGLPYTPAIGSGFGSQIETNSGRRPIGFVVDLRGDKEFAIGAQRMSVFLRVFNLLDATYYNGAVFTTTGSPDYSLSPSTDRNALADPTRYYAPRRIEVGIALNSL
jgi:outer membrane receptor protein involved in Fe transport